MRRLLSLVFLLSLATTLIAQTAFEFAGQTIQPPKNACKICRGKKKAIKALGEPLQGRYYLIAQFKEIPNQELHQKLAESGVTLRDYIAEKTYYVTIREDAIRKSVKGTGIVSLMPIEWQWKVSSSLLGDDIPSFALKGNLVGIVVNYQEEFSSEWVANRLQEIGFVKPVHIAGAPFYSFDLWVAQSQIELIAKEPWVKMIRMVSPPAVLY